MYFNMARPRTIDRDAILDAAEAVVQAEGAGGLSFDAVARAAGVSKGGIQASFRTKQGLLRAILKRWEDTHEEAIRAHGDGTGDPGDAGERVRGHIRATLATPEEERARTAALLAALVQNKEQHGATREWYKTLIGDGRLSPALDRRTRLAFIATEGLFLLKHFNLIDMPEDVWAEAAQDILALMKGGTAD
jgi:AcrR family transcriptional regulator